MLPRSIVGISVYVQTGSEPLLQQYFVVVPPVQITCPFALLKLGDIILSGKISLSSCLEIKGSFVISFIPRMSFGCTPASLYFFYKLALFTHRIPFYVMPYFGIVLAFLHPIFLFFRDQGYSS